MRETSSRLAQGVVAISALLHDKTNQSWHERVLPFHLAHTIAVTPINWSLDEQTRDLQLPGSEPSI
jgi:hypothetical protein